MRRGALAERFLRRWPRCAAATAAATLALGLAGAAAAQESRFAVIALSPSPETEKVISAVEADVARLRPGSRPLEDPVVRRLFASGEGPAAAAARLLNEAERKRRTDDCAGSVASARQAEAVLLNALSLDEERDQLKALYQVMVLCAAKSGTPAELAAAAARLRALISLPPSDFPPALWEEHVAKATPGPATTELLVDSDPPNAQVSVNFHGEGVTPRTLKVAPGLVYVEIQKEGFKKSFRAIEVKDRPARVVLRLIARTHDRIEQAEAQLRVVSHGELREHIRTMSTLAQIARVETLVLVTAGEGKARIWFFDAERGALTDTPIDSTYDPETGRVAALAARSKPRAGTPPAETSAAPGAGAPAALAPAVPAGAPPAAPGITAPAPPPQAGPEASGAPEEALPEAKAKQQQALYRPKKEKAGPPWWSWVIAGAIAVAFGVFVFGTGSKSGTADTIGVNAHYSP
jgi:hypothetical protein